MNEVESNSVKQQIVEKIKSSTNILVTVSKDPSVDDLSATLGLAALLNKIGKHTTAIFSGAIPPAITFLDPGKVFENTADSLRDFIIALDKEKADHLRYKVEGDVVKIFITPYRTTITNEDLDFSQGDFNVELVLALGVENQEHLDTALAAHGQILHDVTIATFSAGEQASQLGSMDWRDEGASSLSEMVMSISEALKTDKPILDKQISTALLTGIVAATERFSNMHTSSRVMTMAAQLMAAGADQQLIAAKLQQFHEINDSPSSTLDEKTEVPIVADGSTTSKNEQSTLLSDSVSISHEPDTTVNVVVDATPPVVSIPQPQSTDSSMSTLPPVYIPIKPPQDIAKATSEVVAPPLLGGILNATTNEAAEETRREAVDQQNKTILNHSYLGSPSHDTAINSVGQTENVQSVDIFSNAPMQSMPPTVDLPLPPPVPDFSTLPPPPMPDFNALSLEPKPSAPPVLVANDPSQFKIPGR